MLEPGVRIVGGVSLNLDKVGRDIGGVAGVGDLGVTLVGSLDEMLRDTSVESVVYCGLGAPQEVAEILGTILDAGRDAITTTGLAHPREGLGEAAAAALAARAIRGGARMVCAGINPGFILDYLPAAWGKCYSRIDMIHARRVGEMKHWGSGVWQEVGIGLRPEEAPPPVFALREQVAVLDDALALNLDRIEQLPGHYISEVHREYGGVTIEPGRIAGFRNRSVGYRDSRAVAEVEWLAVFCLSLQSDGFSDMLTLRLEGNAGVLEMQATGTLFNDPYPATGGRLVAVVRPLRLLSPGVYRPDQVALSA
jgi:2,4-diaminopentanoate dehydrogenase